MQDNDKSFPFIDDPIGFGDVSFRQTDPFNLNDTSIDVVKNKELWGQKFKIDSTNVQSSCKSKFSFFLQPSDCKFSQIFFGSLYNIEKEKQRLIEHGTWTIHPFSYFRIIWQIIMVLLLFVNVTIISVSITFFSDNLRMTMIVFNCITDMILLLDVIINFITETRTDDYTTITSLTTKKVAIHYLRTWFLVDLISVIPFDYIYLLNNKSSNNMIIYAGRALRILRTAKVLYTIRLFRIFRLCRYFLACENLLITQNRFLPLINLVILASAANHLCACLQFFIPMILDYPRNCWVEQIKIMESRASEQYIWSFLKASSNMLLSSSGPYTLSNLSDQFTCTVTMVIGAIIFALIVAHILRLVTFPELSSANNNEKLIQIERLIGRNKLPQSLKNKIIDYINYRFRGTVIEDVSLFQDLSKVLKQEILSFSCDKMFKCSSLLSSVTQEFISDIIDKVKIELFQPGDWITREGTIGTKMYIINEGIVDIMSGDGRSLASLGDGCNFGELCLVTKSIRMTSAMAKTHCSIYSIERESFLSILSLHPFSQPIIEESFRKTLIKTFSNDHWLTRKQLSKNAYNFTEAKDNIGRTANENEKYLFETRLQGVLQETKQNYMAKGSVATTVPRNVGSHNNDGKREETAF